MTDINLREEIIQKAPDSGTIYALYEDRVVYEKYNKNNLFVDEKGLLELHLYDNSKEFRYVKSSRVDIVACVDDSYPHDEIYEEERYTKVPSSEDNDETKPDNKVGVVNYIVYDANDMITIPNYRLKEV